MRNRWISTIFLIVACAVLALPARAAAGTGSATNKTVSTNQTSYARVVRLSLVDGAVSIAHADAYRALPAHHSDPFDRLLVAQAVTGGLTLVTADRALAPYGADLLWA